MEVETRQCNPRIVIWQLVVGNSGTPGHESRLSSSLACFRAVYPILLPTFSIGVEVDVAAVAEVLRRSPGTPIVHGRWSASFDRCYEPFW